MVKKISSTFIFVVMFSASALAAEAQAISGDSFQTGPAILRTALALVFVLVLTFGVIFVLRQWYGRQFLSGKNKTSIHVLTQRNLDTKTTLFVVEVAGKVMLLGSGAGQVTHLADLPNFQESEFKMPVALDKAGQDVSWKLKMDHLKKALHE